MDTIYTAIWFEQPGISKVPSISTEKFAWYTKDLVGITYVGHISAAAV